MTISVIVPVYNVEKYLAKCLDSLVNQTHKEFEIILINDGSTDKAVNQLLNRIKRNTHNE
ncbi:glycosyltransferase [Erysipelothrix sp. D19-032]